MMRIRDVEGLAPRVNFKLIARERGKLSLANCREGHNVFTNVGADWLASLVAWAVIGGGPDVPYTNRRPRWIGLGTGSQTEVPGVTGLVTPALVTPSSYLGAIQDVQRPTSNSTLFIREFGTGELSIGVGQSVPITEAGLFADVYPVSTGGGQDDSVVGAADTTLDPTTGVNPPVAYHTFPVVTKTADFSFRIEWTFTFGV